MVVQWSRCLVSVCIENGSVVLSSSLQLLCLSSAQSLHDLISMTLMNGRGLLEELDGLIGLLK